MTLSPIDYLAAGAALLAIWMCGVTRLAAGLWGLALQTAALALIVGLHGYAAHLPQYFILAGVVLLVKAVAIPWLLARAAVRMDVSRDAILGLAAPGSLLVGIGLFVLGTVVAPSIAVTALHNVGAAGMAVALLGMGMLLMMTRRLAVSQVLGFLVLENGIFLYGLTQTHGLPIIMEMAIVFEVLVGVMIAGLVMTKLNRTFEHIDVTRMRELRH
jgi:hydrogenase-4 component E